ncbi:tRNA (pseudouridine(54)-N(1))-methyltransferase TrmY [Natronorarus salvus]|uniref:tRNA (pseudouridine(54)-N(1))-methyltransferase TrmY n=1 Tax=Natronorarus salvus TaxID=3117733 RepID=UPI002F26CCE6
MRRFIVIGHDAPTTDAFSLDDLAGGAGRLDVLCRCVSSSFFLSHAIREEIGLFLVLSDEFTVRFEGSELRRLNPDERSTAALIRAALAAREEAIGHVEVESTPGVFLSRRGFADVLDAVGGTVIQLHEDGTPISEAEIPENPTFVLSDHHDFTECEAERLSERADARLSVGPEALHANHAITVVHNWLDTGGFANY